MRIATVPKADRRDSGAYVLISCEHGMSEHRSASETPLNPYGGQALIEGVMIRGLRAMAIAVRSPDGDIITRVDATETPAGASLRKVPLLRGALTLYDSFTLGIKSLYWSARVA